ncbi:MAG: hypothetical protein LBQ88_13070 [Treponema sp.]|jgi:hypothetical protein|nr:hypothetical protein [Treponema sp.]
MAFFRKWVAVNGGGEGALSAYVAYAVTSIPTYARGIDHAEWGYNRDHETLRQINIGMFFGESARLPVFYTSYSGSITDKSDLLFMMKYAGGGIGGLDFPRFGRQPFKPLG